MRRTTWLTVGLLCTAGGCGLFEPAAQTQPRKRMVYQDGRWLLDDASEPGSPQGDLETARLLFEAKHYRAADHAMKKVAKQYRGSAYGEEALYWRGEALYHRERYQKAYLVFEDLLKAYEGSAYMDAVLERYFQIAEKFLGGEKVRFLGMKLFRDRDLGVRILERVQYHDPNGPLATRALMRAANHHFWTTGEYELAAEYYDSVVTLYPHSKWQAQAHILGALARWYSYKGADYDRTPLEETRSLLTSAKQRFPGTYQDVGRRFRTEGKLGGGLDRYVDRVRREEASRTFARAEFYKRAGRTTAARHYYQLVKQKYPNSRWAQEADRWLEAL